MIYALPHLRGVSARTTGDVKELCACQTLVVQYPLAWGVCVCVGGGVCTWVGACEWKGLWV